jgi:proline dehydrogenase
MTARWQRGMIRLARSPGLTRAVQDAHALSGLAGRFVAGPDLDAALTAAVLLREQGIATTLFWLGEYVEDTAAVDETVRQLVRAAPALAAEGLDVHLSVDPTQVGLMFGEADCEHNVRQVAQAVAAARYPGPAQPRDTLMIDMEDSTTTSFTLDLHERLRAEGLPVAVTVQAYLHRSAGDVHHLAGSGARVRWVKGALAESGQAAARSRDEIDARYHAGLATLLSPRARVAGGRPSVATHDLRMVAEATRLARRNGWHADEFEFEMLHGVRPQLQRELARRGYRVRAYLPFGQAWFPYAIRRVGESPRNLRFALSALRPRGPAGGARVPGGGQARA